MKRPVTNVAASVRQRLLNEAKRRGESFDYVLSVYARERFLARLADSPHRNRLVLKDEYRGVRVRLGASLDAAHIRLQIDIALGDAVTPSAPVARMPSILTDLPGPKVRVYPPETIVAEKLHALVKLGVANSRMKDFFDLYMLALSRAFDAELLTKAVHRTFARRNTAVPPEPFALTTDFYADRQKQTQWRAFLRKSGTDAPAGFTEVGDLLRAFLPSVLASASGGAMQSRQWRGSRWRKVSDRRS